MHHLCHQSAQHSMFIISCRIQKPSHWQMLTFESSCHSIWNFQSWQMGLLSAPIMVCTTEFLLGPNRDGYGAWVECLPLHPGSIGAASIWRDAMQLKYDWLDLAKYALFVVLQHDVGEGHAQDGPGDIMIIEYELQVTRKASWRSHLNIDCIRSKVSCHTS